MRRGGDISMQTTQGATVKTPTVDDSDNALLLNREGVV